MSQRKEKFMLDRTQKLRAARQGFRGCAEKVININNKREKMPTFVASLLGWLR